jgi:hypothetical protein
MQVEGLTWPPRHLCDHPRQRDAYSVHVFQDLGNRPPLIRWGIGANERLIADNLRPPRVASHRKPRRSEPAGKGLADANRWGTPSSLKNNRRAALGAQRTRRTRMSSRHTRSLCHSPCRCRRDGRQYRRNDHHDRTSHARRLHGRRREHHRVPPSRRSGSRALPPLRVAVRICVPSKFSGKGFG